MEIPTSGTPARPYQQRVLEAVEAARGELTAVLGELVRIPSVNPKYPGQQYEAVVGGETRANERLAREYEALGAEIAWVEVEPRRRNLVGVVRGAGGGRSLLCNGHIDVVPVSQPEQWVAGDPFSGRVEGGRLYGRGACDMKSGLVAQAKAVQALRALGIQLAGDLTLTSVVGEEVMDHEAGASAVARRYHADACVVSEPTAPPAPLCVIPVTSGLWWMSITVRGKPVHASVRDELFRPGGRGSEIGVNAVEKGVMLLRALQDLEQRWGQTKAHPLFKPGHFVLHPGVIQGGPHGVMIPFVVSEFCTIEYSVWYPPQADPDAIRREIEAYVLAAAQLDPWLRAHPPEIEWKLNWRAASIPEDHPITRALLAAHQEATGRPTQLAGFVAVCDATFFNDEGTPSVIYGPGSIYTAHAINEYVEIDEVVDACKTYALVAMDWCGVAD